MNILTQLDGLLWRFGDVVPDAIAMLQDLRVLDARLRARDPPTSLNVRVYALPGDREPPTGAKLERLTSLLDLPPTELASPEEFEPDRATPDDIVLTTSHAIYRQCSTRHIEVIRLSDRASTQELTLPYSEVKRGIEERMRTPTARPMRAGVRKGGLLAIECNSADAAADLALDAIRRDRNADWLILDNTLILYTEDPDLDDRLEENPAATRLSWGVNKASLVVETGEHLGQADSLFQTPDFRLRDLESPASDDGPGLLASWSEVRRRRIGRRADRQSAGFTPTPLTFDASLVERTAAMLRTMPQHAGGIRELIVNEIPGNSSIDILGETDTPDAVVWSTDSRLDKDAGISAWIYRGLSGEGSANLAPVAGIVQIGRWLEAQQHRRHVVHAAVLHNDLPTPKLLSDVLFDDERNRLTGIVEFNQLGDTSLATQITPPTAGSRGPAVTRIDGGRWCEPPRDSNLIGELQAALAGAITPDTASDR